jgi:hypothetical protein
MVAEYEPDKQFVIVLGLERAQECLSAKVRLLAVEGTSVARH